MRRGNAERRVGQDYGGADGEGCRSPQIGAQERMQLQCKSCARIRVARCVVWPCWVMLRIPTVPQRRILGQQSSEI